MPATQEGLLTLEEFRVRYAGEKPYYEYWAGEAIQKSHATSLHGRTQAITAFLLEEIGYDYEPVPDLIAVESPLPSRTPRAPSP